MWGQNAEILLKFLVYKLFSIFLVYQLTMGFKRISNDLLIWALLFMFSSTINMITVNLTSNHYIVPTYDFFTGNSN